MLENSVQWEIIRTLRRGRVSKKFLPSEGVEVKTPLPFRKREEENANSLQSPTVLLWIVCRNQFHQNPSPYITLRMGQSLKKLPSLKESGSGNPAAFSWEGSFSREGGGGKYQLPSNLIRGESPPPLPFLQKLTWSLIHFIWTVFDMNCVFEQYLIWTMSQNLFYYPH